MAGAVKGQAGRVPHLFPGRRGRRYHVEADLTCGRGEYDYFNLVSEDSFYTKIPLTELTENGMI